MLCIDNKLYIENIYDSTSREITNRIDFSKSTLTRSDEDKYND